MSRARGESHVHVVAPDLSQAASRLAWAWEDERRQSWAIGNEKESSLGEIYAERVRLSRSLPPDLSHQLDDVRRRSRALERDIAELYNGTGRWAHTGAGLAARAVQEAAVDEQRAKQLLESPDLRRWSRHKARRAFVDAGDRFDKALVAWENTGQPHATRLEAQRERLGAETALLDQARASREEFFADHPEVASRLAELDRAIAREQENERRRSWELLKEREHARHLGISHELDQGYGIELRRPCVQLVGRPVLWSLLSNIGPETGLGQSAPLDGGLPNNARWRSSTRQVADPRPPPSIAPAEAAPSLARAT